ncbi:hypothetical protein KP509_22G040800 [Ceratopteris richardii]|uniref:Bet v I/Major latex protein domain-containing protein n=1 Tax=Ceratopteris richardii TaxID=49495 RepID=A0A8T2S702_CERRI|nr:hypothetical protein KP509_22G040800 [Ceratopteris richardii]
MTRPCLRCLLLQTKTNEYEGQFKCKVSARRLWRSIVQDAHHSLPNAVPKCIACVEYDGPPAQPGSLRILYYQRDYAIRISKENALDRLVLATKEKFLEVDHDSFRVKIEVVEGGYIGSMVKSYNYIIQFIEGDEPDTCTVHWKVEYKALSQKLKLKMAAMLEEVIPLSIKGIEAYLLSNNEYR